MMSFISFIYPKKPIDLGARIHPIAKDRNLPYRPDWKYIHTPGHAPGHISLFRSKDKVLIAGDAFVTTKAESLTAIIAGKKEISGPPKYLTPDWLAAAISVKKLKDLKPEIVGSGHGPA